MLTRQLLPCLTSMMWTLAATAVGTAVGTAIGMVSALAQTPALPPHPSATAQQADPAAAVSWRDDVELADYLQALAQVSPSASDAALRFMQAFEAKCHQPLPTLALRQAVADGTGDPILMQMIRAVHEHDEAAVSRLSGQVDCRRYQTNPHESAQGTDRPATHSTDHPAGQRSAR